MRKKAEIKFIEILLGLIVLIVIIVALAYIGNPGDGSSISGEIKVETLEDAEKTTEDIGQDLQEISNSLDDIETALG